jgi:hypothetical protein
MIPSLFEAVCLGRFALLLLRQEQSKKSSGKIFVKLPAAAILLFLADRLFSFVAEGIDGIVVVTIESMTIHFLQ